MYAAQLAFTGIIINREFSESSGGRSVSVGSFKFRLTYEVPTGNSTFEVC